MTTRREFLRQGSLWLATAALVLPELLEPRRLLWPGWGPGIKPAPVSDAEILEVLKAVYGEAVPFFPSARLFESLPLPPMPVRYLPGKAIYFDVKLAR